MRKSWWLIALLFVLMVEITIKEIEENKVEGLIADQFELCQNLREDNRKISVMLDKILSGLSQKQKSYQEVKKFKALAQKAEELISENEKLIENISHEKNEKNMEVLMQNLSKVKDNFTQVTLIHQLLINVLKTMLTPPRRPPHEIII